MEVVVENKQSANLFQRLSAIDWDFSDSEHNTDIHSIHPYPAKFIPEIPRTLIRELPIPSGTAILDPFCGAGTTLVEGQSNGIRCIGIDLNPIACLISRFKTTPLPESFLDIGLRISQKARKHEIIIQPEIPNLNHWFSFEATTALSALLKEINFVPSANIKDALKMVLSSIIVKVSNQYSDTRYAAVDKNLSEDDVYAVFEASIRKFHKIKSETPVSDNEATIINADILNIKPEDIRLPIGMVITSPPYPNAYEYWLYHKYRMWWLGFDPLEVKRQEIGARAHFFKKNHHTADDFRIQMQKTLILLRQVVVRNGYICIVIGRSIIHGQTVDNAAIIEEVCKRLRIKAVAKFQRNITLNRRSFNLSHANVKTENILIFQN